MGTVIILFIEEDTGTDRLNSFLIITCKYAAEPGSDLMPWSQASRSADNLGGLTETQRQEWNSAGLRWRTAGVLLGQLVKTADPQPGLQKSWSLEWRGAGMPRVSHHTRKF